MCRLLGIYGQVENWRSIVTAFNQQAESGNVPPVDKAEPGHKDGWGMTISNHRQTAMVSLTRQLGSASDSAAYREALYALPDQPDIFLCHLRKASDNIAITLSNTHPFIHNGWAFIHNGTVFQAASLHRDPSLLMTSDDSDTEHLFHYLLTEITDHCRHKTIPSAIVDAISSLTVDYTSLNFMLSNGRDLYVARCFNKYSDYYTLYAYQLAAGIVICSEPIESEGLDHSHWTLLANNSLLRIHGSPPRIEEIKI
ncbi:MAG: class II glutamine amidotransferase [bacterium]|nr:class II glutamine amidotransferase [bacterium]